MQELAPVIDEFVPGGHLPQVDASEAPVWLLNVVGGQGMHEAKEGAVSISPYVPEGHSKHFAAPGLSVYVPLGHGLQLTAFPAMTCK